jgi:hypothetical protein
MLENLEHQHKITDLKKLFFKIMLCASSLALITSMVWWNTGDRGIGLYGVILLYAILIISIILISMFKGAKAFLGAILGFVSSLVVCICIMLVAEMFMSSSII